MRRLRTLMWGLWLCTRAPLAALESLFFDRAIAAQRISPPLFILGHWRSGTTFLQELMAAVPGHAAPTIYQALFPESFLLTERWLRPALQLGSDLAGGRNHFQRTRLDFGDAAEDDLALLHLTSASSGLWDKLFARAQRAPMGTPLWSVHHEWLLRKLSYRNGGKSLVLKSAQNTWRIPSILARYPEARFIYLHRDPIEVFRSMMWLWTVNDREYAMARVSPKQAQEIVIREYGSMLSCYLSDRPLIRRGRLVEVALAALSSRPVEMLHRIGAALGIPACSQVRSLPRLPSTLRAPLTKLPVPEPLLRRLRREWSRGFALEAELTRCGGLRRR